MMRITLQGKRDDSKVPSCTEGHHLEGHGELILLVDDDPEVLHAYSRILERLHYNVLVATDGKVAIDMYRCYQDKIDLLILDFVLPKFGGDEVMQIIRAMDADAKLIIITGHYSYNGPNSAASMEGYIESEAVLLKPFSVFELEESIRCS